MKKYQLGNLTVSSLRKVNVYDEYCKDYRERHTIKISNGKINKYFTYTTEIIKFIDRKNFYKNVLYCIYQDYLSIEYHDNEKDFIEEYGDTLLFCVGKYSYFLNFYINFIIVKYIFIVFIIFYIY